jgi:hypothetical protein
MYATDRSPGTDVKLTAGQVLPVSKDRTAFRATRRRAREIVGARRAVPFGNGELIPDTCFHARPGRSLSEDCHKSPRSLPAMLNAVKSRVSRDAPGIPSSARDHSLSSQRRGLSQELRKFRLINFVDSGLSPEHTGPIIPAPEHQVYQFWIGSPISVGDKFWILDWNHAKRVTSRSAQET